MAARPTLVTAVSVTFANVVVVTKMLSKVILPLESVTSLVFLAVFASVPLRVVTMAIHVPLENIHTRKG